MPNFKNAFFVLVSEKNEKYRLVHLDTSLFSKYCLEIHALAIYLINLKLLLTYAIQAISAVLHEWRDMLKNSYAIFEKLVERMKGRDVKDGKLVVF